MTRLRVGALQLTSGPDRDANLATIAQLIDDAAAQGCDLVALPEVANLRAEPVTVAHGEPIPGPTTRALSDSARRHQMWVHAGSLLERAPEAEPRLFNTSVLISPEGEISAVYRKIHLFDVDLADGSRFRESDHVAPGDEIVVARLNGIDAGLSICYDLRFPELYRQLAVRGARLIFIPAAFTAVTGRAHWHVLVRARAIENQAFVVAPAQLGETGGLSPCYGHSLIVDPWGVVLAEAPDQQTVIVADLDFDMLERVRTEFPSLAHRRLEPRLAYV